MIQLRALIMPSFVLFTILLQCSQVHKAAAQSAFSAIFPKNQQTGSGSDKNEKLTRAEILNHFSSPPSNSQAVAPTKEVGGSGLAVKIWICPAVAKADGAGQASSQQWEPGMPVNPEEVSWEAGQVFFVRFEASKPVYLSLFYIKMGETPKLFSPAIAYPETFEPVPAGYAWTSPPIALDNDNVPEVLDWIAVSKESGLLSGNTSRVSLEVEVAVRAFLQSAAGNPQATAYADAQATLVDKDELEDLSGRLTEVSKIIYGKTKDIPSTKMGYVVPVGQTQNATQDDLALLGFGPEGIAHGLLLFSKTNEGR